MSADADLLIYDGDCGFCTTTATWLDERLDARASAAAWQSLDLDALGLSAEETSSAVYWHSGGRNSRGADGIASALRRCGQPWSTIGALLAVPPLIQVARALYPVIAKNRHRLPGATTSCEWHSGSPPSASQNAASWPVFGGPRESDTE